MVNNNSNIHSSIPMSEQDPMVQSTSLRSHHDAVSTKSPVKTTLEQTIDPLFVEKVKLERLRLKLKSTKKGVAFLERFIARREERPPGGIATSDLRGTAYHYEEDDWEPSSPSTDSSDEDFEDFEDNEMESDSDSESREKDDDGLNLSDISSTDSKSSAVDRVVETNLSESTKEELKGYIKLLLKKIDDLQGRIHKLKRQIKDYQHRDDEDKLGNLRRKLNRRVGSGVDGIGGGSQENPNVGVLKSGYVYREVPSGGAKTLFELDPKFGRDLIIHPRVPLPVEDSLRLKLQKMNETPEEHEYSDEDDDSDDDDRVYYSAQYQQEDLDFIKISTLPSTGLEKPYHDGTPKEDHYYMGLFDRIVQNLNIWVEKYFEPNQGFIDIDSPQFNTAFKGLIMHTDFFKTEVFTAPTPATRSQEGDEPTKMARCNKLPALYRAVLFAIISMEIFEPWIVALDEDVIQMIREEQQLRVEDMFSDVGIMKRANYFIGCIRQSLPSCAYYDLTYKHCFVLTQRLKAIFEPLFVYTKDPTPSLETRTSFERELFLMLSECYALQIMFQSEKDVMYKVTFARPGEEFNESYMLDVTDYYAQAPGRIGKHPLRDYNTAKNQQKKKIVDCSVGMGLYRRGKVIPADGIGLGDMLPAFVDGRSTVQAGPLLRNSVTTKDEEALTRPFLVPEFLF